jgi:hypothetical protein
VIMFDQEVEGQAVYQVSIREPYVAFAKVPGNFLASRTLYSQQLV